MKLKKKKMNDLNEERIYRMNIFAKKDYNLRLQLFQTVPICKNMTHTLVLYLMGRIFLTMKLLIKELNLFRRSIHIETICKL